MRQRDAAGWLASRLADARADAERIARELAERGHLPHDQVASIAAAVDTAVERGRELIVDALREPRRALAQLRASAPPQATAGTPDVAAATEATTAAARPHDDVSARIDALEARIAALEDALQRLTSRARRGSEGD